MGEDDAARGTGRAIAMALTMLKGPPSPVGILVAGRFQAHRMNLSHRIVRFRVVDIYFPDPSKVLLDLHHDEHIEGEVIDLSDSGSNQEAYAVIKVDGLEQLLTVPTERLELAEPLHVARKEEA